MTCICSVQGCVRVVYAKGWCNPHYQRDRIKGSVDADKPLRIPPNEALSFFTKALSSVTTDECVEWPYCKINGYGQIRIKGKLHLVPRLALTHFAGPPPSPDMECAHRPLICHNPSCFNPHHLRWATRAENAADMIIDGTSNRGTKSPSSKLTKTSAIEIRTRAKAGEGTSLLAKEYSVSPQTVSCIKAGRIWAWAA